VDASWPRLREAGTASNSSSIATQRRARRGSKGLIRALRTRETVQKPIFVIKGSRSGGRTESDNFEISVGSKTKLI